MYGLLYASPWWPLSYGLTYPRASNLYLVDEMRDLLLDHGATNTKALRERWIIRKSADENEPQWLENFHHDPR